MGYYAIGALLLVAGGLGVAYVVTDPFGPEVDQPEVAVAEGLPEKESGLDAAVAPELSGSADRRMDDFGTGPSGVTVTVPLRDRHKQAYAGSTSGGGGGTVTTFGEPSAGGETDTAALAPDGDAEPAPAYRVIERDESESAAGDRETAPSFDVVRVDPQGGTVMAGRAAPFAEVEIRAGDKVIDRVTAAANGEWVSTPIDPLAAGDQELSLRARTSDGEAIDSRQIVVVSVPEPEAETQPVAVVVDKEEGGEGRVLQAPDKLESPGDERLALKLVDYDDDGAIRLSGEAPPGVPVRIYVDNRPAALVIGDSKGYWITTLDQDLPAGDYTLRLDQLDVKGQTVARLETPLTRVATPPAAGEAKVDYVVVQPGNSLWRIARRLSGDGFNYVYIFEANQAQIRDPDVIYPGQVFEVPAGVDLSAAPSGSG